MREEVSLLHRTPALYLTYIIQTESICFEETDSKKYKKRIVILITIIIKVTVLFQVLNITIEFSV